MPDPIDDAIFQERRRIAKLLHDGLSQDLMAACLLSSVISRELTRQFHPQSEDAASLATSLSSAADRLRRIFDELHAAPSRPPTAKP